MTGYSDQQISEWRALARRLREHSLRMVYSVKSSHIGSCLSVADVMSVLYGGYLNIDPKNPAWADRDRVVVSKGHAAAVVYASLTEAGFFDVKKLETYGMNDSPLSGHVTHTGNPGVEVSSGSLGHGLSWAAGFALAAKRQGRPSRGVAILSDGECDEGSIWEAALFAPHHGLSNLLAIVDFNKIQSFGSVEEVLPLEPFADKWRAFRWHVQQIDGHDHAAIAKALAAADADERPSVIIADTVKGKGVPFMENQLAWHYKSPNDDQLAEALAALEAAS